MTFDLAFMLIYMSALCTVAFIGYILGMINKFRDLRLCCSIWILGISSLGYIYLIHARVNGYVGVNTYARVILGFQICGIIFICETLIRYIYDYLHDRFL